MERSAKHHWIPWFISSLLSFVADDWKISLPHANYTRIHPLHYRRQSLEVEVCDDSSHCFPKPKRNGKSCYIKAMLATLQHILISISSAVTMRLLKLRRTLLLLMKMISLCTAKLNKSTVSKLADPLQRLTEKNVKVSNSKYMFSRPSINCFGYTFDGAGIRPDCYFLDPLVKALSPRSF